MKANLKGRGGIKGLALLHGEKVAMALVAVLALWFIYSSLQLPTLGEDKQADDLTRVINDTDNAVKQSQWPASPDDPGAEVVKVFKPVAKTENFIVEHDKYALSKGGINPPVV